MTRTLFRWPAITLVVLILMPFTAPFQTFAVDSLPQGQGINGLHAAAIPTPDDDESLVTPSVTFVRWKTVIRDACLSLAPGACAVIAAGAPADALSLPVSRPADPPAVLRV